MSEHDIIFAGAGHNNLVTAAYAARAGFRVLVLEGASPGVRRRHFEALVAQPDREELGDAGFVVDDKDLGHDGFTPLTARA